MVKLSYFRHIRSNIFIRMICTIDLILLIRYKTSIYAVPVSVTLVGPWWWKRTGDGSWQALFQVDFVKDIKYMFTFIQTSMAD